jgi:hypothetical protein
MKADDPAAGGSPVFLAGGPLRWDIIELLFFAYRDFVGDADHVLEEFGFGRAHHRVVHFVTRYPGLKVADLLDVLRITKQSLGRVLKQLLDEGYIIQKAGDNDRRQRLSPRRRARPRGEIGRIADRAHRSRPRNRQSGRRGGVRQFLLGMIDHTDPDKVLEEILRSRKTAKDAR